MKRASSEARKSAALAVSHALPIPPFSGTIAARAARCSSSPRPSRAAVPWIAIGVSINPGRIALHRTPFDAEPCAVAVVSRLSAAFEIS